MSAPPLTQRRRKDSKYIEPAKQIAVRRADRIRMVTMASATEQDQKPDAPQ